MITIVQADDWMAVYKDNTIVYQGHSISPAYLLFVLGIDHEVIEAQAYADSFGHFPADLLEVVEDDR
jgi:hypothetical protein